MDHVPDGPGPGWKTSSPPKGEINRASIDQLGGRRAASPGTWNCCCMACSSRRLPSSVWRLRSKARRIDQRSHLGLRQIARPEPDLRRPRGLLGTELRHDRRAEHRVGLEGIDRQRAGLLPP